MVQVDSFQMEETEEIPEDDYVHDDNEQQGLGADGLFSMLPDELVQYVFKKLDMKSYLYLSFTCSRLYEVCIVFSLLNSSIKVFL